MVTRNIEFHVHPFFERYGIDDVLSAMDERNIDCLGLLMLNKSVFPYIRAELKDNVQDGSGVAINENIIFNSKEYDTCEGFQIYTVGSSIEFSEPYAPIKKIIDSTLEEGGLCVIDHPFVENSGFTAGHISYEKSLQLEDLCKEYSGQIALEWNGYCNAVLRKGIMNALNGPLGLVYKDLLGFNEIEYSDVNRRVLDFSKNLFDEGFNVPVIADTDLHARRRNALRFMGTARVITDCEGETPYDVLQGIKANIFHGRYENVYDTVSASHLLRNYCFHVVLNRLFLRPRG